MADGYVWFEGIPFPVVDCTPEHLRAMQDFVFKDEDVLTVSFPKSGKEAGAETEAGWAYVPPLFTKAMESFLFASQ